MANSYLWASKLEQKASVYIRKWFKLHKSIRSLSFYSSASPCSLPVRSLTSVLKFIRISGHLLLKHLPGPSVSSCVPKLQAGNWEVEQVVQTCEADLRHNSIIGNHQHTHLGMRYIKSSFWQIFERIQYIYFQPYKEIDDTCAISKAVQFRVQDQWTRWLSYIQQIFFMKIIICNASKPFYLLHIINSWHFVIPKQS